MRARVWCASIARRCPQNKDAAMRGRRTMPKSYVGTRYEYFSEHEATLKSAALRRVNDETWRVWLDLVTSSHCLTCSVLLYVPYDDIANAYKFGHATVQHELGCPIA